MPVHLDDNVEVVLKRLAEAHTMSTLPLHHLLCLDSGRGAPRLLVGADRAFREYPIRVSSNDVVPTLWSSFARLPTHINQILAGPSCLCPLCHVMRIDSTRKRAVLGS